MALHLRHHQSGQAIALAAVAMIAVVGAVAFVIDLGFFFEGRRELQNTADSAALAGVVYLPNCSVASASCPALSNAQDAANAYVTANGPIVRQLCGHPTVSVAPSTSATPGIYDTSTTQPGLYYTFTVSLSCNPGFSFGRILFGSLQEPIAASATAIIGSLGEINCSAPLDVVAYSWGNPNNNWGYLPGLGNIPGSTPGTLLAGETNYLQTSPGPPPTFANTLINFPSNSPSLSCPDNPDCSPSFDLTSVLNSYVPNGGAFTELCLDTTNCGGNDVGDWFAGRPCVTLDVGSSQNWVTAPGDKIGPTGGGLNPTPYGLIGRGFNPGPGNSAVCPQTLSSVIDSNWNVLANPAPTPCLIDLAILDYGDVVGILGGNGRTTVTIRGFGTMFLQRFNAQGGNKHFEGVMVQTVHSGRTISYQDFGTHATRLIR
jgi:Flp pilus assembly protein TadG